MGSSRAETCPAATEMYEAVMTSKGPAVRERAPPQMRNASFTGDALRKVAPAYER